MTPTHHVVIDGSNIATEGRSMPSLEQLEQAVAELRTELPDAEITVVVDATFAHRIDPSERERFEAAVLQGTYVSPPAGAIGRGDAFLLRIAERVDAMVVSNDSFQEFHATHPWLFDRGRLLGATPVAGVGWIFMPRTPVRGPKSRIVVRRGPEAKKQVAEAIMTATREAVQPNDETEPSVAQPGELLGAERARSEVVTQQAVNDPVTFIGFIAEHPLGDEVTGTVESFASHGAVIRVGEVRCYVPLSGLSSPPPKSAREVLRRGEERSFVVTALDPHRRGVELALPPVAVVSGRPSEETVEAEVVMARSRPRRRRSTRTPTSEPSQASDTGPDSSIDSPPKVRRRLVGTKARSAKVIETSEPVVELTADHAVLPPRPRRSRRGTARLAALPAEES